MLSLKGETFILADRRAVENQITQPRQRPQLVQVFACKPFPADDQRFHLPQTQQVRQQLVAKLERLQIHMRRFLEDFVAQSES